MSGYRKQHTIPKVYLKHFAEHQFVFVQQFQNRYRLAPQKKGIGDKIFCQNKYYDFPNRLNEPVLEKFLSKLELSYETLIGRLQQNLFDRETKRLIIEWVVMMKIRNEYFRDRMSSLVGWIEKTKFGITHGAEEMTKREGEFASMGRQIGKDIQLVNFLDSDQFNEIRKMYAMSFLNRAWTISTSKDVEFITSDNPGFSYTFSEHLERLRQSPVSSMFNLTDESHSVHVFPLTNSMCLTLLPILWREDDTKEIIDAKLSRNISLVDVPVPVVDAYNAMTVQTAHQMVISKDLRNLERYAELVKLRQNRMRDEEVC